MPRIRFTNSAETDLLELWLHIAEENLVAADESLDSIQVTVSLLATQPEMGRARPELADGSYYPLWVGSRICQMTVLRQRINETK